MNELIAFVVVAALALLTKAVIELLTPVDVDEGRGFGGDD